ncbi:MAG: SDR family NAD(P)-dependent oxidoreductase, partial [Bacteroidaceae bacterium]
MVILITGITSGFGRAMAQRLSQDGHKVYGTFRRESEPIPGVTYIKADVRDEDSLKSAVNQVLEAEGHIDTLISNAGMGIGGPLEFTPMDDARLQMDVNFMGMVRLLDQVVPVMRRQRHGHIICISSIGGLMGLPYQGMYSASKFAIEGYCEALRLETQSFGIKVVVLRP